MYNITEFVVLQHVSPRDYGTAIPELRDTPGPRSRAAKAAVGSACDPGPGRKTGSLARPQRGLPLAGKLWRTGTARARSDGLRDPTCAEKRFHTFDRTRAPARSGPGSGRRLGVRGGDSRRSVDGGGRPLQGAAPGRIS